MNPHLPDHSIESLCPNLSTRPWHRSRARVLATGLGILSAAALAAGGTTTPSATATTAGNGSATTAAGGSTATTAATSGSSGPPLIVYAAEGYDKAMTMAFQKATGIVTKLDDDSTGPLLAKVQAEINNPQWGVLWVDGDDAFAELDNENYLVKNDLPYNPSTDLNATGQSVVPKDHSYIPTGVTGMAAAVYNSKMTKPPTSYDALTGPQWKNEVGMNNPAISGPTYPFVAGIMNQLGGVSQGEAYFTKLKANGLKIYDTNTVTLHALTTGQIKVALIQSSSAARHNRRPPIT
ncbi:MAG: ABC transporter substrate-binding protein [Acidimicrobiales bacterium]